MAKIAGSLSLTQETYTESPARILLCCGHLAGFASKWELSLLVSKLIINGPHVSNPLMISFLPHPRISDLYIRVHFQVAEHLLLLTFFLF